MRVCLCCRLTQFVSACLLELSSDGWGRVVGNSVEQQIERPFCWRIEVRVMRWLSDQNLKSFDKPLWRKDVISGIMHFLEQANFESIWECRAVEQINTEFAISAFQNVQFIVWRSIGTCLSLNMALVFILENSLWWKVGYSRNAWWRKQRSATKMANGHWPWILLKGNLRFLKNFRVESLEGWWNFKRKF